MQYKQPASIAAHHANRACLKKQMSNISPGQKTRKSPVIDHVNVALRIRLMTSMPISSRIFADILKNMQNKETSRWNNLQNNSSSVHIIYNAHLRKSWALHHVNMQKQYACKNSNTICVPTVQSQMPYMLPDTLPTASFTHKLTTHWE